jgi:hypothetical protein
MKTRDEDLSAGPPRATSALADRIRLLVIAPRRPLAGRTSYRPRPVNYLQYNLACLVLP